VSNNPIGCVNYREAIEGGQSKVGYCWVMDRGGVIKHIFSGPLAPIAARYIDEWASYSSAFWTLR